MNIKVVTTKDNFDFEDYTIGSDNWNVAAKQDCYASFAKNAHYSTQDKDEGLISIFAQSIEIFGSTMAPWPASVKANSEQANGLFITSESSPKEDTIQVTIEANKPQIQSKLRRSNSSNRQNSICRINEENILDAQTIYNNLEPIPIVTVPKAPIELDKTPQTVEVSENPPRERKASRLHNWIASIYYKTSGNLKNKLNDEELAENQSVEKPVKSILKKSGGNVQKSASISEKEAACITSDTYIPQKKIKLRFDNEVIVCETFHKDDYSRQSLDYVARQLTPSLALSIKKELNGFKQEMEVHEDARHLTQFYLIK